jgi:hypothetical protein
MESESVVVAVSDSPSAGEAASDKSQTGNFRERVGSRRTSYQNYADSANIFTAVVELPSLSQGSIQSSGMSNLDQNESSILGPISENEPTTETPSKPDAASTTPAQEAARKPKHGLRRWVDAGGIRLYLFICLAYPLAQIVRIFSDIYVRYWAEKTFFSSQQANLEVYSYLVGG